MGIYGLLEYLVEKTQKIYPCGLVCLFVVGEMFIEVALFQETSPAMKNS